MGKEIKYWKSVDELNQTPEFLEVQSKEFLTQLPAEGSFERRDFLKLMGASLLLATTACGRRPVEKIIPYVNRPEEIIPGVPNWYTSTCNECAAQCGLLVKTREGRPIKLEGNPEHPVNKGGLCSRGQASLLNLYDPDRIKGPAQITSENAVIASWEAIDKAVIDGLNKAKQAGKKIVLLTGSVLGPSTLALIKDFSNIVTNVQHIVYDPLFPEEVLAAQKLSYGQSLIPAYRFEKAKNVVSFGADFLGTWGSPVENAKRFSSAKRKSGVKVQPKLFVFASQVNLTSTNADKYFPVKPGDEVFIALSIAHELLVVKKRSSYAGQSAITSALAPYSIEAVSKQTGISEDEIRSVADLLLNNPESLVLGGPNKAKNSLALEVAVNLINSIISSDGSLVDWMSSTSEALSSFASVSALVDSIKAGDVGALIIHNTNPAFSLNSVFDWPTLLKKVPLVVNTTDRVDETAKISNIIAPAPHYLETWGDHNPKVGVYTITQPVIRPLNDHRAFQESLIVWSNLPTVQSSDPSASRWYGYLTNYWNSNISATSWDETLQKGIYTSASQDVERASVGSARNFNVGAVQEFSKINAPSKDGLQVSLFASISMVDGRSANNSWLQELPDPVTKLTWGNALSVAPEYARNNNLKDGDIVSVSVGNQKTELQVHIQPKLHPQTAQVAFGYGRTGAGQVGNNVGGLVSSLQNVNGSTLEWTGLVAQVVRTGKWDPLSCTQIHSSMEGRELVQEIESNDPKSEHVESEELITMWPVHEYKGYRWGMAIDMNSCIGCSACVTGCQSENNIPVVGREKVILGRSMHWMRLDRYYKGENDANPDVAYLPMMCQHCENAPCETVCPVLATVHDSEGLNVQVYNRCVGTRYCANNCPYKVRRFNWFDYSKNYVEPMNLVLNPDVTTRSKGVMEKCTFCVQRIKYGKDIAKDQGRLVKDGEIKTACQQTCPADAIVFGNINDPNSKVSQLAKSGRKYHVLEELNVKPQVTYLKKIRV